MESLQHEWLPGTEMTVSLCWLKMGVAQQEGGDYRVADMLAICYLHKIMLLSSNFLDALIVLIC